MLLSLFAVRLKHTVLTNWIIGFGRNGREPANKQINSFDGEINLPSLYREYLCPSKLITEPFFPQLLFSSGNESLRAWKLKTTAAV